jgi:NADH dehydrogenase, FAD-containing subunit
MQRKRPRQALQPELAWAAIHVYLLVGFQHRLLVSLQWLWRYLTYERGARLIAFRNDTIPLPARDSVEER